MLVSPELTAQTHKLEAYSLQPSNLRTGDITSYGGMVRNPAGSAVESADYRTTGYPAGTEVTLTTPVGPDNGTPQLFLGWAPTPYDQVTGYAAAITTNPLKVTLNSDRKLIGYVGRTVDDTLNTPGRVWTSGGNALWIGTFDVFAPEAGGGGGVARATMLSEVGDEAWLESSFEAPTILSYTWRLDLPTGEKADLEALVDGEVADTIALPLDGWKVRTLDLTGSGPVSVRFRLSLNTISTIPVLKDRRGSAYLAHVKTGQFAAPADVIVSNTSSSSATLSWKAAYGAQSYTVELANDAAFTQGVQSQNISSPTVTTIFYGLTNAATYYYRVLSNRTGYQSLVSNVGSFVAKTRQAQTITFPQIGDKILGAAAFSPGATSSSELPVVYKIVSGNAVITEDGLVNITGVGGVHIRAEQNGNDDFEPANSVNRGFNVSIPTNAKVALTPASITYTGQPQALVATTTPPNLPATYTYQQGGNPATTTPPTNAGTYTVTAKLNGMGNNAPSAKSTLKILKAPLTVSGGSVERLVGQANPPLTLSYSGFLGSDGVADIDVLPVPATSARASSPVGTYPITFTGGRDNNYQFVSGSTPGAVTVRSFGTSYEALLIDSDNLPTGKLTLTLSKNSLAYTGSLILADEAKSLKLPAGRRLEASLDLTTGTDTVAINLPAANGLGVRNYSLQLSLHSETRSLEGNLYLGGQLYAVLDNGRLLEEAAPRSSTGVKGTYTLLLPPATVIPPQDSQPTQFPQGAGYAAGSISDKGKLTLTGKLADGTTFTTSAQHDHDKAFRIFVKPHGKRVGQRFGGHLPLISSADFTTAPNQRYRAAAAQFVWEKPGLTADKSYKQGFGPLFTLANFELGGPPAARIPASRKTSGAPAITLAQRLGLASSPDSEGPFSLKYQANLLSPLQQSAQPSSLRLKTSGSVILPTPNSTGFKLKLNAKTGVFTGEFTVAETIIPPAKKPETRKANVAGILRQGPTANSSLIGQGHIILPALKAATNKESISGAISLEAP